MNSHKTQSQFQEVEDILNGLDEDEKKGSKSRPNQADILVGLGLKNAKSYFIDQFKAPYAAITVGDHTEISLLESTQFRRWLGGLFYRGKRRSCHSEAIRRAVETLSAKALYDGDGEIRLHNRVAWHDGHIFYDLSNENWEAVRISKDGWEMVADPPILLRRFKNQTPQVIPAKAGNLRRFLDFVNVKDESLRLLILVWLVSAFIPDMPHVVPVLYGAQGSAKTFLFKLLKWTTDPGIKSIDALPRSQEDLIKKLFNNWMTFFDNLSSLPAWASDTVCRAVTGEGHSERLLYTNLEEIILSYKRVVGLNGINVVATRPDLLDRSIIIELERIRPDKRKREEVLHREFREALPSILGGALDVLSKALTIFPDVEGVLTDLPRMADFSLWGYCIAEAMGGKGRQFLRAYESNIQRQNIEVVVGHPVAYSLVEFMKDKPYWTGKPEKLLGELQQVADRLHIKTKSKVWPSWAHVLIRRLNELKTNFFEIGIEISTGIHTRQGNIVEISKKNSFDQAYNTHGAMAHDSEEENEEQDFILV